MTKGLTLFAADAVPGVWLMVVAVSVEAPVGGTVVATVSSVELSLSPTEKIFLKTAL